MTDETKERRHSVAIIKETAQSANNGRSYLLKGLWACRLAAGLNQRARGGDRQHPGNRRAA